MTAIENYGKQTGSKLWFYPLAEGSSVFFYAFLTSFDQSFASQWNQEIVYGRNDPIGTFQGTQRTLNLAWDLPAGNLTEAESNMRKIAKLTQMLYPTYSSSRQSVETPDGQSVTVGSNALTLSKPPLVRLKYANLINDSSGHADGLLGFISSLSITPSIDMGMFTSTDAQLYPKVYALSLTFTVLHEHDTARNGAISGPFPFGG